MIRLTVTGDNPINNQQFLRRSLKPQT